MDPSSLSEQNLAQPEGATTPRQLHSIKAQLDLVLLALEALTGLGSDAMLAAAEGLGVSDLLSDRAITSRNVYETQLRAQHRPGWLEYAVLSG